MLAPETVEFLESDCAIIIGTVSADGVPHAARAWGITVLSTEDMQIRLLLNHDDDLTAAHLADTGAIAITAANVRNASGVQLKGRAITIEDGSAADVARGSAHADALFAALEISDGTASELLERMRPDGFRACVVDVCEVYDQTPGPHAGVALEGTS